VARFASGFRTAGAGSTTLPIASIYAVATRTPRIFQVGVFNTTATAVSMALRRATTVGTTGAARDELPVDDPVAVALATVVDTHTVGPTLTAGAIRTATLGAAIGSGVIWTFSERGLEVPAATTNGLCIVPLTGTGQICDIYLEWAE
jgi:hypothetical protein